MAKGRKVFTAMMEGTFARATATAEWGRAVDSFEAQEDITVIGLEITAGMSDAIESLAVAGSDILEVIAQVSQAGQENDEGVMGEARYMAFLGLQGAVTPNEYTINGSETVYIRLPGDGITIDEDGDINLHVFGQNTSAGTVNFAFRAIIYYVKGQSS